MEKDAFPPTIVPASQDTSVGQVDNEKPLSRASSMQNFPHESEERVLEMDGAETLENLSDDPEYPSGLKLGIIMVSLSLSVFLMALVSRILWFSTPGDLQKILTLRACAER